MRPSSHDNCGRRQDIERRRFTYTAHLPERRSGGDRRSGRDRRRGAGTPRENRQERRRCFQSAA